MVQNTETRLCHLTGKSTDKTRANTSIKRKERKANSCSHSSPPRQRLTAVTNVFCDKHTSIREPDGAWHTFSKPKSERTQRTSSGTQMTAMTRAFTTLSDLKKRGEGDFNGGKTRAIHNILLPQVIIHHMLPLGIIKLRAFSVFYTPSVVTTIRPQRCSVLISFILTGNAYFTKIYNGHHSQPVFLSYALNYSAGTHLSSLIMMMALTTLIS